MLLHQHVVVWMLLAISVGAQSGRGPPPAGGNRPPPPPISSDSSYYPLDLATVIVNLPTSSPSVDAASSISSVSSVSLVTSSSVSQAVSTPSANALDAASSTTQVTPTPPAATLSSTTSSSPTADPIYTASGPSVDSRTLIITLSVCIASLLILALFLAFLLARRYRIGRSPFRSSLRRGATPIGDDEIATWRGNTQTMSQTTVGHTRNVSSIVFKSTLDGQTPPTSTSASSISPANSPAMGLPSPVAARAPNARSGLTDEAIPGAVPFVATCRRESRRLSKMASTGHVRSKSRRSSTSITSLPEGRPGSSRSPWVEPDDWAVRRERADSGGEKMPIPMSPVDDDDEKPGGLSPRPGRARHHSDDGLPGAAF